MHQIHQYIQYIQHTISTISDGPGEVGKERVNHMNALDTDNDKSEPKILVLVALQVRGPNLDVRDTNLECTILSGMP